MAWLLAIVLASSATEVTPTESTHGCVMKFCDISGGCAFIFFVKVANDEYDSDEGEAQIWGYDPQDKQYDRNGHIRYVSVAAKRFIRAGAAAHVEGQPCICHCPSW